jgi:hypothetical protein
MRKEEEKRALHQARKCEVIYCSSNEKYMEKYRGRFVSAHFLQDAKHNRQQRVGAAYERRRKKGGRLNQSLCVAFHLKRINLWH